ncbi:MAG: preprotein translocase subunit SecE [Clostridiales bacterium]
MLADNSKKKKRSVVKFFKEMKSELKKVIWPDRKQLINNTLTVLMACGIIGSFIWLADKGLQEVVGRFLLK